MPDFSSRFRPLIPYFILPFLFMGAVAEARLEARVDPIRAVCTFSILADWVREIGGDKVHVTVLVASRDNLHAYQPVPNDLRQLRHADILFEIGLEAEPWFDRMVRASATGARRVRLSDGLPRLLVGSTHLEHHSSPGVSHTRGHRHDWGVDPHIWMHPERAASMVVAIHESLAEIRPEFAAYFEQRARSYLARLRETDRLAREWLEPIPENRRFLVTPHDSFSYFAQHYGFRIPGSALSTVDPEHFDPSPADVRRLVDRIRRLELPAVFPVVGETDDLLRQIARQAGVALSPPLYCPTLDEPGSGQVTSYLDLLSHNARIIRNGLYPENPIP